MSNENQIDFSKLLLAVDGSDYSVSATEYLSRLHLVPDCRICVIAVLDTPHTPRRQLLLAALEQSCDILRKQNQNIECGLLHGHPAASIIDFANDYEPDVIILGSKGLRATLGILLGGVAQQVVEHAHWPVLVVRPADQQPNRFLIAVDGSKYSQAALEYIVRFGPKSNGEYHIIHVVPPMPAYDTGKIPRTWQIGTDIFQTAPVDYTVDIYELHKNDEAKGLSILEQAVAFLDKSGFHAKLNILHGDAATEILEYAKNNMIDMIIVGSRGLSEVSGWLLGSVSRKLVHYATCSVLIVKQIPDI
jgi:nucleotide-binding universal stress UspA family protein